MDRGGFSFHIHRLSDGAEVGTCAGPTKDGRCPRPAADGTVPCAGHVLVLPLAVRGTPQWRIPEGWKGCLAGSYDVFCAPG